MTNLLRVGLAVYLLATTGLARAEHQPYDHRLETRIQQAINGLCNGTGATPMRSERDLLAIGDPAIPYLLKAMVQAHWDLPFVSCGMVVALKRPGPEVAHYLIQQSRSGDIVLRATLARSFVHAPMPMNEELRAAAALYLADKAETVRAAAFESLWSELTVAEIDAFLRGSGERLQEMVWDRLAGETWRERSRLLERQHAHHGPAPRADRSRELALDRGIGQETPFRTSRPDLLITEEMVDLLLPRLKSRDPIAVEKAVVILARSSDKRVLEPLRKLQRSSSGAVRHHVAGALVKHRDASALHAIAAQLRDPDRLVRLGACMLSRKLLDVRAAPLLLVCLRDEHDSVRSAAARALEALDFNDRQQRRWASAVTATDALTTAAKLLSQASQDQPRDKRLLAIRSLGMIGLSETLPQLIEFSADADQQVAAEAVAAINKMHAEGTKK